MICNDSYQINLYLFQQELIMFEQHRPLRIVKNTIEVSPEQYAVRRAGFPKSKDSYRNFRLQRYDISAGLTDNLVLFYEVKNKQFKLVNYDTETIIEAFPVSIQQTDSEFQLHYFNRSSTLCLVQKLTAQGMLRLHYFKVNIKEEQVQPVGQPVQHPFFPQYHLSYVNNEGTIAWCGIIKQILNIKIYNQGSGIRQINADLTKLNPIFERDTFKVLRIWQHENLLYVAISPTEDQYISYDQMYSPFLVFNHKVQGECPVQFSSLKIMEALIQSSITSCINVEDYCVIQTGKTKDTYQIFIYDKQIQQILLDEKVPTNNFEAVYYNNMIAGSIQKQKDRTQIIQIKIIRENFLPYQKILEIIEIAEASSKEIQNAILILGEDKTGKSMTRHFLAGGQLIHVYNEENGFYEMILSEQQAKKEAIDDREKIPWMKITESTAIIDIPNWNQKGQFFKAQIMILFARLFKIYSNIQVLITIPLQYIEQSLKNEEFFRTVLEIFGNEEGVEDFISIMLTKVDSVEENLQSFQERIEQITQINEDVGNRIKKISEQNRILCFENREINEGQGLEMLNSLLSFNKLSFNREKTLSPEQALSESSLAIDLILYESQFYARMLNVYLLNIAHKASPDLFNYVDNIIRSHVSHTAFEKLEYKANESELAATLIKILAKIKKILTITQEQNFYNINKLKGLLLQLVQQQTGQQKTDDYYFYQIILAFISVMKNSLVLPIQRTTGKESTPFSTFIKIFETQSDGILGKNIKQIITTFQSFQSVTSLPQIKQFAVKGGPKIKRVTRVQMTYEEEKKDLQKKKVTLEDICKLPSNALKLDLILEELIKIKDKPIDPQNLKLINFYLRQSSRICQYHKLYYESIYFLFVIPDFYGIEMLIDEFVQHKKKNHSYEIKSLLNTQESDLVQRLLTLSRECVRDNLVRKLINLRSLSAQTSAKPSKIRSDELKAMKTYLSNSESLKRYRERLEKKDTTFFYQLKDSDFLKVLFQKQGIIKRCQQFQEEKSTKKKYEDKEALKYVLDNVPIPIPA